MQPWDVQLEWLRRGKCGEPPALLHHNPLGLTPGRLSQRVLNEKIVQIFMLVRKLVTAEYCRRQRMRDVMPWITFWGYAAADKRTNPRKIQCLGLVLASLSPIFAAPTCCHRMRRIPTAVDEGA